MEIKEQSFWSRWGGRNIDLLFTFGLFGTVILLILPVPPLLMDLLLAISIGVALMILLIVIYVKNPPEFSVFPTLLLTVTLYRLGLNVASTRLILLDGYAGQVIDSFGNFVVQANYVVGLVVFLILVIINFIVITKGAGRIAEVAARFTLDAMPGKQMAIDAELNAGLIDENEATARRTKIQKEADFYGSMDGASKFVRGDAVAGILITLINILGGIAIGVFQKNLGLLDSIQKFTILSIGDGLVSQIPALIVSISAGILITRSSDGSDLGSVMGLQFNIYPRVFAVAGVMLALFSIFPGMPALPFLLLAGICGSLARFLRKKNLERETGAIDLALTPGRDGQREKPGAELPDAGGPDAGGTDAGPLDFETLIRVDAFAVELGHGLIPLADPQQGGDLIERITGVRKNFAKEMGVVIPPIAIRDNVDQDANSYRFLLRNREVVQGTVVPGRCLAMNVTGSSANLKGIPTVEPVFGLEAVWILEDEKKNAELHGYTVVDAASVLITHLSEALRNVAYLILEREDVQKLIDMVKESSPTLISELLPDLVSVGLIQRVLQNLLKEKVPIKNLNVILETVADFAEITKNPDELAEQVRRRLGLYFIQEFEFESGLIKALTLDPGLEQYLVGRVSRNHFEINLMMDPPLVQHLMAELQPRIDQMIEDGLPPLLVTTGELRLALKRFFEPSFPRLAVLAYQEMPPRMQIENFGIVPAPAEDLASPRFRTNPHRRRLRLRPVRSRKERNLLVNRGKESAPPGAPNRMVAMATQVKISRIAAVYGALCAEPDFPRI